MPYYHVYIHWEDEVGARWGENIDFSLEQITKLVKTIKEGTPFVLKNFRIIPFNITKLEIWKTEERAYGKSDTWRWIPSHGVNVTNSFIIALPTKPDSRKIEDKIKTNSSGKIKTAVSKNVFIVYGRDETQALLLQKYLKDKLKVDAVMFDDLPDKGRTIIEQLEYIQDNVGYAFVIVTPDDVGCLTENIRELAKMLVGLKTIKGETVAKIFRMLQTRARQNVVFELGLFMGALGREKVCCLLKRDTAERPSDIDGVLYKRFNESVSEIFHEIPEELKAAGYEIKI